MTAKGTVFLALEDETGMVNVTLWPDTWARLRGVVRRHALLLVDGELQREGEVVNVDRPRRSGHSPRWPPRPAARIGRPASASSATPGCAGSADRPSRPPTSAADQPRARSAPGAGLLRRVRAARPAVALAAASAASATGVAGRGSGSTAAGTGDTRPRAAAKNAPDDRRAG